MVIIRFLVLIIRFLYKPFSSSSLFFLKNFRPSGFISFNDLNSFHCRGGDLFFACQKSPPRRWHPFCLAKRNQKRLLCFHRPLRGFPVMLISILSCGTQRLKDASDSPRSKRIETALLGGSKSRPEPQTASPCPAPLSLPTGEVFIGVERTRTCAKVRPR